MQITSPVSGSFTGTSVTIRATVTDNTGLRKVELRVDNIVLASRTSGPFTFNVVLKPGARVIKVTGRDNYGLESHATVRITVSSSSSTKPAAPTPPSPSPSLGGFGTTCSGPDQCSSKLCATDMALQRSYCTQDCSQKACPSGSGCFSSSGGMQICAPLTAGAPDGDANTFQGSGCSVGATHGGALPALLLLLLGLLFSRRRR